jgi:hypothetical protein
MKKLLLSLTFAAMSSAALAAEPLTAQQMDAVTAGVSLAGPFQVVASDLQFNSVTGITLTATTQTFFLVQP